jgi:hypothetical protein
LTALWEDLNDSWESGGRDRHVNASYRPERKSPRGMPTSRRRISQ